MFYASEALFIISTTSTYIYYRCINSVEAIIIIIII